MIFGVFFFYLKSIGDGLYVILVFCGFWFRILEIWGYKEMGKGYLIIENGCFDSIFCVLIFIFIISLLCFIDFFC